MDSAAITILVIDDQIAARATLEGLLSVEPRYSVRFAASGAEGLSVAQQVEPDVILLDVMMPEMDGFEVCRRVRDMPRLAEVPVLLITSLDDRDSRLKGLRAGADDFISKPFDRLELLARLQTITRLNRFRRLLEEREHVEKLNAELLNAYDGTIVGWSKALDLRDRETEGHTQRVTKLALELAKAVGITGEADLLNIRRGALLHDVGKLGVPDAILLKPGTLTDEEWGVMRLHPVFAYEWLSSIEYLRPALDIPYCHHEKWDGSGYPRGLGGEAIPLSARVFALIDVWDALTNDRPYRKALARDEALAIIRASIGTHFDPAVAGAFLNLMRDA